jgi:5'-3' exonuclease
MQYLLIDGNNLAIRSAFGSWDLKDSMGIHTGIHYGFFKALISLKKNFRDRTFVICWDGKSKRRMQLSSEKCKMQIIPSVYKANREKNKTDEKFIDFYNQLPQLQEAVNYTGIQQVYLPEFEADDVISSYCKLLRDYNNIIVSTTDHDYYQILHDNVSIWDGLRLRIITKQDFEKDNKITPEQYVDVGALMGDNGDNIFGIPSWGDKTSFEEIQKHISYKNVLNYYVKKYSHLEDSFPAIESMLDLESLRLQKTKSGKQKYPDVYYGMPFSGVALAIEWKKIDPIPQKAIMLLMYQDRLDVAYSLKKVDDDINDLPEIKENESQIDKLQEYFEKYSIKSLSKEIIIFKRQEESTVSPSVSIVEKNETKEKSTLFDF